MTLIPHGFQSQIMYADGSCPTDRRRGSVLTPHASLMQDVPCLPLSGPFGDFRDQDVPGGCWTECMLREPVYMSLKLLMFFQPPYLEHTA